MPCNSDPSAEKHKRIKPPENRSFCMAPWTHTFISPQSERRLCCASRETHSFVHQYLDQPGQSGSEYKPVSLDEHWNGEFLRSIRIKMLKGERVKECEVCDDQILNLSTYRNWFTQELFPHYIDQAFAMTDDQGFTQMRPISFDYRLNNTCNFKCRMCGEQLSSAWELEKRRHNDWDPKQDPWMVPQVTSKIEHFQKEQVQKEFLEALRKGQVEEIYWVGGEPLMWDFHWNVMKELVENGFSKNILVRYNTNLSIIQWRGTSLFDDLLPHFKRYLICASIDSPGKIGAFIRTGLNWERWLSQFKEGVRATRDPNAIAMDVTLTLPGLFGLKELFEIALELDVLMICKLIYTFDPKVVLSPLALPRVILEEVVNDIIRHIEPRLTHKTQPLLAILKNLKERKTFEEAFPETYLDSFKMGRDYQWELAKRRGDGAHGRLNIEDIYKTNDKVLEWWLRKI